MATRNNIFTTIRTEGALLPADLLQRISEGEGIEGLTSDSYHHPREKLNEVINRSWNVLQAAWRKFRAEQERLPADDKGTTITREYWLLPLFRELDYGRLQTATAVEIDGRSYPISHAWEHVPIHLVSYKLDLDKRAQGVAGAASASPHSLLQTFLNRSEGHLWGFVSNGYKLRILRDNISLTRQAYVEFDLEVMMEGEVYSDFVLLWLLCHQSRVEGARPSDCWLEKWMKIAEEQGTRALEQLRDGVQQAIETLGAGFLEHPQNAGLRDKLTSGSLSARDYYRQLLRLVYRLLFLFVAEDRDLLLDPNAPQDARQRYIRYYSTQRLRRIAERFKGSRHPDLFEGVRLVMTLLSGDRNGAGRELGLVPLGSFLFSDRAVPDIIHCQISNRHLLTAIRALSLTYDQRAFAYRPVDYKNLGSDELGSVFESLLELHPQIDVSARFFALATAAGNERKTTGSYYTPESLVGALLDSALNPVLDAAARKGEGAVLALKVCDPACGSGHFLIAAANRMAKKLASVRTGEQEPSLIDVQQAKRDVISHCIYGVDINPMAVELCKVNLWMEALEPGKPLSFLDHRIQVGNSLLGTTPKLMADGIPDDAFSQIEGDDKAFVSSMKRENRHQRQQRAAGVRQHGLFDSALPANYAHLSEAMHALDEAPDDTLAAVRHKEAQYAAIARDPEYVKARLLADAWCAAFVWEKKGGAMMSMTDLRYRRMEENPLAEDPDAREYIAQLADRYQFFHWHLAFPDVFTVPNDIARAQNEQTGWDGGFDVVLGNPPWERIKIQKKEWFAERLPEVASAPNAAIRDQLIEELEQSDPALYAHFLADLRKSEGESHFIRNSGRYPLCGRGDVNTYSIFAETSRHILNGYGRAGMIVPSGIATDDTTKFFFQDVVQSGSLVSMYDFENREKIFPAIDSRMKFALVTMRGVASTSAQKGTNNPEFAFFLHRAEDLEDPERRFTMSADEIAMLNPNTRMAPIFRTTRDAEITKGVYRRIPILTRKGEPEGNPWGITFKQGLFHMTSDSHLFHTRDDLESAGYALQGNHFVNPASGGAAHAQGMGSRYLPLYEAKMMHQFTHRWATYQAKGGTRNMSPDELRDPSAQVMPRYWLDEREVAARLGLWDRGWLLGFRDISSTTNERTAIFGFIPRVAVGNKIPIVYFSDVGRIVTCFQAGFNSHILDYCARQKIGGNSLNFYLVNQLPIIPPRTYTPALVDFIAPRVLELTYTAWDLQPFAQDMGYDGPPFVWDDERRFLLRCELDALYFHLYQIPRDDVDYIMETFPIVKRADENAHGEYRTKRVILAMYDQMAGLPTMAVPAPMGDAPYIVPDVSYWTTWLEPKAGDPLAAHKA